MSNEDVASQWPPASPKDVLRLTPKKPGHPNLLHSSPLRNSTTASPTRNRQSAAVIEDSDATTSEEDEEALQLQLKAIEMKLKLKRLQKEKKRKAAAAERAGSAQDDRTTPPPSFEGSTAPDVQIPVSPSPRKRNIPTEDAPPASPSRVLLGIDKGLKARDVSLKRAPGMTNLIAAPKQPQFSSSMSSTASTATALRNVTKDASDPFASKPIVPTKTFSERIAEQRSGIQAKENRAKENEKLRSKSWNLGGNDATKTTVTTISSRTESQTTFASTVATTSTAQSARPAGRLQTQRTTSITKEAKEPELPKILQGPSSISGPNAELAASKEAESIELGPGFDSYSGLHLSRRNISHTQLSRHLNEKEIFLLPNLLKTVHSPDYDPPDVAGDWVVMGIVSSKSEPREVARQGAGKYIVVQITDLKWEIELFFFGSAFQKYYRVSVGTVLAILNPNIMKPRNNDSGKFSLTLSDNSDTLLEVGVSRDLGACKARKKDGKECGTWIDKRHTEFCDFHVEQAVAKTRAGRMEVNSMGMLFEPPKKGEGLRPKRNFLKGGRQVSSGREDGLLREGPIPDLPQRAGGAGGNVYVNSVSTAKLIDHDMTGMPGYEADKAERLRKALARREKEREIAKGLMAGGNANTGMDYLKANIDDSDGTKLALGGVRNTFDPGRRGTSEADRNLLEDFRKSTAKISAAEVSLSPVKSKRKSSDMAARSRDSPSPPLADGREVKRTRKEDRGGVGWAQADVKKHLERNVTLTNAGGLKQTQLGFKGSTRSRSRSPEKRVPIQQGIYGMGINTQIEPVSERVGSPTKSNLKGVPGVDQRRDSKSVKFAPMPISDDSSDDDLEILGM
ncbi:hypothetical protein ABW19_dt0203092 [Dactylella cylindrospora]|nr:hypothetical protein ABW19_dt0203092 [Dactylella cylindrospora]